jgi:hypothetical protein
VALERHDIEKRDFPIGRRGYESGAVDAHLSAIADQIEELRLAHADQVQELKLASRSTETVSSAASERVRGILEAAEASAADIQRQADDDGREIRAQAAAAAQATRERAIAQARDHVGKVSESTAVMLQRLDAMESELVAMLDTLRGSGQRVQSDLEQLDYNLVDVREAANARAPREPEGEGAAPAPPVEPELQPLSEPVGAANGGPRAAAEDSEGARLIALNMALNGAPREETDRYLADNFELSDRASLLDEVYASVEG